MRRILLVIGIWTLVAGCQQDAEKVQHAISGPAQGSTFMISYLGGPQEYYQSQIDSILVFFDQSMSTWVPSSTISKLNAGDTLSVEQAFQTVLDKSIEIYNLTNGAFNVTVGPLVRAWGFGATSPISPDSAQVDSLLKLVGMQHIQMDSLGRLFLENGTRIDFNAIAQGYTVDVIAEFLEGKGVHDYMVEVGGELRTKGVNVNGRIWTIGIDKPQESIDEENRFQVIVQLKDKGLATSGNYRKFYIDEASGQRISHTISPKTGYPAKNNLLSATVVADQAMDADAYATAFMVMGIDGTKSFIGRNPQLGLEVYLVYADYKNEWETWMTPGFSDMIK
jgi:thiamine biosynthesis lipoprotein